MADGIRVSVLVVSYNHDRFIAEAIDSVLMQRTDFDYEIVVGDDCSEDATRRILSDIRATRADRIRLLFHERRLGPRGNYIKTLEASRGEYVACLDGDDYWTSAEKLQKQVDFLDAHPSCPLCCHNARFVYEDPHLESTPVHPPSAIEQFLHTEALLVDCPALTTTTMLRRNAALALRDIPVVLLGDKARAVTAAHRYGAIGYIDEVLSAWRVHAGGVMNSKWQLPPPQRRIKSHQTQIEFFEAMDDYLGYAYHELISQLVVPKHYALAWCHWRNADRKAAREHLRRGWSYAALPGRQTCASLAKSLRLLVHGAFDKINKQLVTDSRENAYWKARSRLGTG